MLEFHIKKFSPIKDTWPNGGWSLYQMTAEQIVDREMHKMQWCGFVGCYETPREIAEAIAKIEDERGKIKAA